MYVNVSSSHNFVQDLSNMLNRGVTPKVYFTLFETSHQIDVLKKALNILNIPVSGVLLDETLVNLRKADYRDKIRKTSETCGYHIVSLADVSEQENVVIVVVNHPDYFHLMIDFLRIIK